MLRRSYRALRLRYRMARARTNEAVPIFHIGRCGSTVLNKMLQQHPKLRTDSEIYPILFPKFLDRDPGLTPERFTRDRFPQMQRATPFFGRYLYEVKFFSALDMTLFPGGIEEYCDLIRDLGVRRAVILERRNLLRRIVSTQIAVSRGAYQLRVGEVAGELPRVKLSLDATRLGQTFEILDLFDRIEAEYAALRDALTRRGIGFLDVSYEDHIEADPKVAFRTCCDFIGVKPTPVDVPLGRINTAPLRDIVTNFDAVCDRLAPTRHAWMLET